MLVVAPLFTVVPVAEMRVSGGVVSMTNEVDPVAEFPAWSCVVMVGFGHTLVGLVAVHVTIPPVDGDGLQVVPGIEMVSQVAVGVHVNTTATVLLLGFGVAVQVGAVGGIVSTVKARGVARDTLVFPVLVDVIVNPEKVPLGYVDGSESVKVPLAFVAPVARMSPVDERILICRFTSPVPEIEIIPEFVRYGLVVSVFTCVMVGASGTERSTVKVLLTGVGSVFPAGSIARKATVCDPLVSPVYVLGVVHPV